MRLLTLLRKIKRIITGYSYQPSIEILISRKNLLDNLQEYKKNYSNLSFAPVLKSNAYGHGLVKVAQILDKENISFFALDSLPEAMTLRQAGIKSAILIIGFSSSQNIRDSKLSDLSFAITSLEQLQELNKIISSPVKIHLKIDTGMHRQGLMLNQVESAINIIKANKFLILEGIFSHLADADNTEQNYSKSQLSEWKKIVTFFKSNFSTIKYIHILASAGMNYYNQAEGNVARLGIGLYGINVSPLRKLNLQPALQMQSIVSSLKDLTAGEKVGYNVTYQLPQATTIATVPVGYFEGVDRRLSNQGYFKINDNYCPIVGRISMNITSIDVGDVPGLKLGDKVTIISSCPEDKNSVVNIAKLTQTIPWEVLIHIPQHLRRTVVN